MSTAQIEKFAGRPFSFYPPILNIEHNEWTYLQDTWAEILVHNTKTGLEIWVPRRYLGEVSRIDEPVMIVGLVQELEYKGGTVWPHNRRVIEMPELPRSSAQAAGAAPVPPPPRESATEKKIGMFIAVSLGVAIIGTLALVAVFRTGESGERVSYEGVLQQDLNLTASDDYFSVVRKLGPPAGERWRSEKGERQYQALAYPRLSLTLILMGADRKEVRYIGAKDGEWRTVHSVKLPGGAPTDSILRSLPKF